MSINKGKRLTRYLLISTVVFLVLLFLYADPFSSFRRVEELCTVSLCGNIPSRFRISVRKRYWEYLYVHFSTKDALSFAENALTSTRIRIYGEDGLLRGEGCLFDPHEFNLSQSKDIMDNLNLPGNRNNTDTNWVFGVTLSRLLSESLHPGECGYIELLPSMDEDQSLTISLIRDTHSSLSLCNAQRQLPVFPDAWQEWRQSFEKNGEDAPIQSSREESK